MPRPVTSLSVLATLVLLTQSTSGLAAPKDARHFEQQVRPLLVERCLECHTAGKKTKGGLALDSKPGWKKGGDSGPALLPGKPDDSLLIRAVGYADKDLQMPPKEKLSEKEIGILRDWIAMGAPDPREETPAESGRKESKKIAAADLWSFQPVKEVEPPRAEDPAWSGGAIDRFVWARLKREGLSPADAAEPAVLLRRMRLDLTGLPPTPTEVKVFGRAFKEDSGKAIEAAVDRLLASESFGDRWARHWLDLTAYADTIGVGRSIPALEAWRYRDYVITTFNADKPFDRFIRQQIAGDIKIPSAPGVPEGPDPTAEGIVATGFLAIGPWELVGGDKPQLRMDVVDRQINRVGKAFLGMTFECARCHEHKFDPVSQEDYYGLAGVFRSTVTLNGRINGVFSAINHTPLPESADDLIARAERIRAFEAEKAGVTAKRDKASKTARDLKAKIAKLEAAQKEGATTESAQSEAGELDELKKRRVAAEAESRKHAAKLKELEFLRHHRTRSMAMAVMDTPEPEDAAINIRGNAHQPGRVIPRGFPEGIAPKDKPMFTRGGSGRVQLAEWIADKRNPLTARVWVNRVWHHLFGAGLVRTADNFGATGEAPSHPELLDHLAAGFMRDGWSTKKLIRRIVLSRTWRQASVNPAAVQAGAEESDPNNRLLWRANRRRLEAEAIRDAMLFVSGRLDLARGGPSLPYEVAGNLSPNGTGNFKDSSRMPDHLKNRRTIYLPQKRKGPFDEIDFINAFDLPDNNQETGRRTITAVPTQALYLANSRFAQDCGKALAELFAKHEPQKRLKLVYQNALNRRPSKEEKQQALALVGRIAAELQAGGAKEQDAGDQAWARLCHSLLMSNEFLFRN